MQAVDPARGVSRRDDGEVPRGDTHVARAKMHAEDAVGKPSRRVDREVLRVETQVTLALALMQSIDAVGKLSRRVDREALRIETQVTRARTHAEDAVGSRPLVATVTSRRVDGEVSPR